MNENRPLLHERKHLSIPSTLFFLSSLNVCVSSLISLAVPLSRPGEQLHVGLCESSQMYLTKPTSADRPSAALQYEKFFWS